MHISFFLSLPMAGTITLIPIGTVEAKVMFIKPPEEGDYDLKTHITYCDFCSLNWTNSNMEGRGMGLCNRKNSFKDMTKEPISVLNFLFYSYYKTVLHQRFIEELNIFDSHINQSWYTALLYYHKAYLKMGGNREDGAKDNRTVGFFYL